MRKLFTLFTSLSFIGLSNLKAQTICTNDTIISIANAQTSDVFRTVAYGNDIYSFASQVSKYSTVNNNWSSVLNMPTVRVESAVAEVNGIIYTLGGWTGSPSNKNEAYNISSNTWSTMTNLPSALTGCFAVSLNNKVYIIGGTLGTTTTSFYEYNPSTNTYSTLATPSQSRMHAGLVAYNNKIYFIGGHYYNGTYNSSNKLDEYDPSLNTWSPKTNIPVNIQRTNGTIYDNKLYLFGGTTATPTIAPLNSFYVYDFVSDSWTTMPNLPFSRASFDPKTINGIVYLFGGHTGTSTVTDLCYKYYCPSSQCQAPLSGLIGNYPFTGNANDISGNGNHGTNNGASLTTDRFGSPNCAYLFNGVNSNISVPNIAGTGNSARSIFAWIKTNSTIGKSIVGTGGLSADAGEFNLVMGYGPGSTNYPGKIGIMGGNFTSGGHDFYPNSGLSVNDNTWHQVGTTYDGSGNLKIYIDGILANQTTITYSTTGQVNFFGYNNHNGSQFDGLIDDILIYNRELSPTEITSINCTSPISTGIKNNLQMEELVLFPNPASEIIHITNNNSLILNTSIFTISGQLIQKNITNSNSCDINISQLVNGFYFIQIETTKGNITKKIIKN